MDQPKRNKEKGGWAKSALHDISTTSHFHVDTGNRPNSTKSGHLFDSMVSRSFTDTVVRTMIITIQ